MIDWTECSIDHLFCGKIINISRVVGWFSVCYSICADNPCISRSHTKIEHAARYSATVTIFCSVDIQPFTESVGDVKRSFSSPQEMNLRKTSSPVRVLHTEIDVPVDPTAT